jgi:hypothetical protein
MNYGAELKAGIESRFGKQIVRTGIIRKWRALKTDRSVRRLLSQYLDETRKHVDRFGPARNSGNPSYAAMVVDGAAPQRPGVDFLDNGRAGLHVYGFLNQKIESAAGPTWELSQDRLVSVLRRWWLSSTRGFKKKAHHFVFSMDPRLSASFAGQGIPVDDMMLAAVAEAFLVFNNRYFPGGTLGWVAGVHHDRFHVHVHVLLYPTTSTGKSLNVSRNARTLVGGKEIRVGYQETLERTYLKSLERMVGMAKRPGFADPEICLSSVAHMFSTFDASRRRLAQEGKKRTIEAIEDGWWTAAADPDLSATIAANRAAQIEDEKNALDLAALDAIEAKLLAELESHERAMQQVRERRQKTEAVFRDWRSSRDNYHPVRYTPDTPPQSPSGTLSLLGYPLSQWPRPSPSRGEVERKLNGRLERLDRMQAAHEVGLARDPSMPPQVMAEGFRRCLRAVYCGCLALNSVLKRLHLPTLTMRAPQGGAKVASLPEKAAESVKASVERSARELARMHHTATTGELQKLHDQMGRTGAASAALAEDPVVELDLPSVSPLVPATSNFIEREARLGASIRTMSDLRREEKEVLDRISKVISTVPYGSFAPGPDL